MISAPSKNAAPLTRAPRARPSKDCMVMDLPLPDSPTTPRVRPLSTENDASCTALTTPSGVWNDTERSRTSSRGIRSLSAGLSTVPVVQSSYGDRPDPPSEDPGHTTPVVDHR